MSSSCICSSPPPAAHQHHTHTYTHYMHTCTSHLKLTHLPLEDCRHHFSTSLCVVLVLPSPSSRCLYSAAVLFVSPLSKPVFVSIYLSSLTDVTPVFHFIPASCSSLINKQMTSPVLFFFFLNVKWSAPVNFCPQQALCSLFFSPIFFASRPQVWIHLVISIQQRSHINIAVSLLSPSGLFLTRKKWLCFRTSCCRGVL